MPSPRPLWKGHVSFGLVNVPVTLYSAEQRNDIHFHLLDSQNAQRVRYQRVNEETGEEVPWDRIVKGYEHDGDGYVLLDNDELEGIRPELTRQIEIEDFVRAEEIDPVYFDKPYYLEPGKSGQKAYALLRQTLQKADRVGISRVVIRSREHLAALMVRGDVLVLEVLRFPQELREPSFLEVPENSAAKINDREVDLALQLVESMTIDWDPGRYHDDYRESLLSYIEEKVRRGEMTPGSSTQMKSSGEKDESGDVVDLMDYLKQSVQNARSDRDAQKTTKSGKAPAKKASKKKTAKKTTKKARKSSSSGEKKSA